MRELQDQRVKKQNKTIVNLEVKSEEFHLCLLVWMIPV